MIEAKPLNYKLEYFDDGKLKQKNIKIDFINHRIINMHGDLNEIKTEIEELISEGEEILKEIYLLKESFDKPPREKLKLLRAEKKSIEKEIKRMATKEYFKRRVEIIKTIMKFNKIEDKELSSFDFWENKVQPPAVVDFLNKCVTKDIEKKDEGAKVAP